MQGKVSIVSLGCSKALVDSERLITELARAGFETTSEEAEVAIVNTCGFIDAAREESLDTIATLLNDAKHVVVTGCMGADAAAIRARFPEVAAVTGPEEPLAVVDAVAQLATPDDSVEYLTGSGRRKTHTATLTPISRLPRGATTLARSASFPRCVDVSGPVRSTQCSTKRVR